MADYGKKFESITKATLAAEGACFDRLPDQMSGLAGSVNPGDFTAYLKPDYLYIECKSCQSEDFDIKSRITEGQWIKLLEKSKYARKGVCSGYLIWFVNEQKVYWISATMMKELYSRKKSFKSSDLDEVGTKIQIRIKRKNLKLVNLISTIVAANKAEFDYEEV